MGSLFFKMSYHSTSFSFFLVTVLLYCTLETAVSYQLIPQKAKSFIQQSKQRVLKRPYRNLDDDGQVESAYTYEASKPIHLGVVGTKLQEMALKSTSGAPSRKNSKENTIIAYDIQRLRQAVLDDENELKRVRIENYVQEQTEGISDHQVLQLIKERYDSFSTPGNRMDNFTLALAMEGGGMRGCVSAGMAAAIASLGLTGTK